MQIGDLVRGKINELIGVVTKVNWTGDYVTVYWFEIELPSTTWIHTFDLEAICNCNLDNLS